MIHFESKTQNLDTKYSLTIFLYRYNSPSERVRFVWK